MGVAMPWSSNPVLCRADKRARPIPRTRPQRKAVDVWDTVLHLSIPKPFSKQNTFDLTY